MGGPADRPWLTEQGEQTRQADACPECGQSLEGLDREAHAEFHWPLAHLRQVYSQGDPRHFQEAINRREQVTGKKADISL